MNKISHILKVLAIFLLFDLGSLTGEIVRIKDVVSVRGLRDNQLTGIGVVVGLPGTGDSSGSIVANKAAINLLTRLGMAVDEKLQSTSNMAVVMVTADLRTFRKIGERIDVTISAIGDAKNLSGGQLVMTNLKGLDGQVYVVAQGKVVVGAADGASPKVTTVARVTQGGIIEREFSPNLSRDGQMLLSLIEPDFTTSLRAADAINEYLSGPFAQAHDPASVTLLIPDRYVNKEVELMAEIENLFVEIDRKAMVVINERTGTIVMGDDVKIGKVSISHGGLSIQVKAEKGKDGSSQSVIPVGGTSVGDLVKSLNQMGVKPKDLISIIQALHASGAMSAELRVL